MGLFGGIESGGTKFVCMIGSNPDNIIAEQRIPTTNPEETIRQVIEFFNPYVKSKELTAVGIASFGPIDLNPASPTYGFITTTPKEGWKNVDLYGQIQRGLNDRHLNDFQPSTFDAIQLQHESSFGRTPYQQARQ